MLSKKQRTGMIDRLSTGLSITAACQQLEISRLQFYRCIAKDAAFAEAVNVAKLLAKSSFNDRLMDTVEAIGLGQMVETPDGPVFDVSNVDVRLLIAMYQNHRPEHSQVTPLAQSAANKTLTAGPTATLSAEERQAILARLLEPKSPQQALEAPADDEDTDYGF